jgi:hypothetical protein
MRTRRMRKQGLSLVRADFPASQMLRSRDRDRPIAVILQFQDDLGRVSVYGSFGIGLGLIG